MSAGEFSALAGLLGALMLGVMSPGPSFLMVAQTALARSRRAGLMVALGMGLGGLFFAALALGGLHAVFATVPALYAGLRLCGGLYLLWLGWRIFSGRNQPLAQGTAGGGPRSDLASLLTGLGTQVSNPKTAVVYASVFAAFLQGPPSAALALGILLGAFVLEAGWYGFVALGLSAPGPRARYLRFKAGVDAAAGGLMAALGLGLVAGALRR